MEKKIVGSFIYLIKKLREEQKFTIEQLADLANVHRTTIGLLERGERTPTLQVAQQIASALGYPISVLLQKAELINSGKIKTNMIALTNFKRKPKSYHLRNEDKLITTIGIDSKTLLSAIETCYQTLDAIDEKLTINGSPPIANLVELANLSSMIGNIIGAGIANNSNGLYERNKPHTYPDLVPLKDPAVNLEVKIALETNKPKGHLPKPGTYITFRYILADKQGVYQKGKQYRGDTVWVWEVKVGDLKEEDFSCSNTEGDSGKTAMIKNKCFNKMALVYYVPEFLPHPTKRNGLYIGYN